MNPIFAIRTVAATIATAKRFKVEGHIFPHLLFQSLVKEKGQTANLHLEDGDDKWRDHFSRTSKWSFDKINVSIQSETNDTYLPAIVVGTVVHGIYNSLLWYHEQFSRLDTIIVRAVRDYVAHNILNLVNKVEIPHQLYLSENMQKQPGVLFAGSLTILTSTIEWVVKASGEGIEIKVEKRDTNNVQSQITHIPWYEVTRWLE